MESGAAFTCAHWGTPPGRVGTVLTVLTHAEITPRGHKNRAHPTGLQTTAHALQPALKEAFWNAVEEFSKAGGIKKKEAFFWLTQRCSEMNSSRSPNAL